MEILNSNILDMLTKSKQDKLTAALKAYCKKYLQGKIVDLDESGTRLMINSFLSDVLTFAAIDEIKTEYMIRGTYADYMVQVDGKRYFLVEVKAFSLALSEKHLRQTINYGANEGVEWALLTNGKQFDLYRIIFDKPIQAIKLFTVDLNDTSQFKKAVDCLQYLHRDTVIKKGLDYLFGKSQALDVKTIANLLFSPTVIKFVRKSLITKYKTKFSEKEIENAINHTLCSSIDSAHIKPIKIIKDKKPTKLIAITTDNNNIDNAETATN